MIARLVVVGLAAIGVGNAAADASFLPDDVISFMQSPPSELFYENSQGYSAYRIRPMTPQTLALAARAVLTLDVAEVGAPKLDPMMPFGSDDVWQDMADVFGTRDDLATARAFMSFTTQLNYLSKNGRLAPGAYRLKNTSPDRFVSQFSWRGASASELGFAPDGAVVVTEDHLKLIPEMIWEWPNEYDIEDAIAFGEWPVPGIDPKRPYGAMSYFQLDVHRVLGWPILKRTAEGYIELTDEQVEEASRLHYQMLGVMQVFLERAELP